VSIGEGVNFSKKTYQFSEKSARFLGKIGDFYEGGVIDDYALNVV
jgi:hypothetical protein